MLPLDGVRVLAVEQYGAGPYAAAIQTGPGTNREMPGNALFLHCRLRPRALASGRSVRSFARRLRFRRLREIAMGEAE